MFRLLALLQLTRAALAFTAIADAWTVLLLYALPDPSPVSRYPAHGFWVVVAKMLLMSIVSAGLYGFGMSLNDLMDMRHDRIFARWRPLPSGRIRPRTAIVIAILLLMLSFSAAAGIGAIDMAFTPVAEAVFIPWSVVFAMATAVLIVFYDATAKYLGGLGLVTLGAIRALHCLIGNPKTPLLFLSMFLLTHVIVVSLIAYQMEGKRPRLKRVDWIVAIAGVLLGNVLALVYMFYRHTFSMNIAWMLLGPLGALLSYTLWAIIYVRLRRTYSTRKKGERLMLMGLFWLFIYDASILFANGQSLAGIAVTVLLICAILSFFGLRWLGRWIALPEMRYRRERGNSPGPAPAPGTSQKE